MITRHNLPFKTVVFYKRCLISMADVLSSPTFLGNLGENDTKLNDPICIASPMVAHALRSPAFSQ